MNNQAHYIVRCISFCLIFIVFNSCSIGNFVHLHSDGTADIEVSYDDDDVLLSRYY